jgi:hypothetical protein
MRFIVMHKTNAHWETGAPPGEDLVARVGSLLAALAQAGALISGEGLRPSSEGVRLRFSGGRRTILPGPFERGNELPAGFNILRTASPEEAIEWATRQAAILGDGEIDIRPVTEGWDIGIAPRPAELASRRYMVLRKATASTETGAGLSGAATSDLARLIDETTRTGVHLAAETMAPSRRGRRLRNTKDGITFFDGPFLETKELIGGYVIVEAESLDAAARWAEQYIEVVDAEEVDVRELE